MNRILSTLMLFLFIIMFIPFPGIVHSQESASRNDITGTVRDIESGEALPYANVLIKGTRFGTATNTDGYFVLVNVPVGVCSLQVKYIGYVTQTLQVKNFFGGVPTLAIDLEPTVLDVGGVTVTAQAQMLEASSREISQISLSPRQLATLPSIGEVDVFRSMQLLPGISGASDGESGLYVRGGTPDQNLVIFDGMTIYHVDHFFGFFSAFNADAIKDIQIYKGGFPAEYGGRVSSVIHLTGKTGDQNRTRIGFGANLLSAHASLELPVFNWGTLLLAGRRSYTDFIQSPLYDTIYSLMTGEESGSGPMGSGMRPGDRMGNMQSTEFRPNFYFYDVNAKLTMNASTKDLFTLSFYNGKDDLDKSQDFSGMNLRFGDSGEEATLETTDYTKWGNTGLSGKWSRQWNNRFHTDVLGAYSHYFSRYDRNSSLDTPYVPTDDSVAVRRGFSNASEEDNNVKDITLRIDSDWHVSKNHTLRFGTWISDFDSKYISTLNDTTQILDRGDKSMLSALYLQDKWKMKGLELTLGLRGSYYGLTHKMYYEPRFSLLYSITDQINLKGAWGQYNQFVNRITNENVLEGSRDFWMLSDENLKPSFAEHQIIGLSYDTHDYFFSVEAYNKNLNNLVEFTRRFTGRAQHYDYFFTGKGNAKGLEFLAQKKRGALTGWIGYTLGKVDHQFSAFNNGDPFPADNDRRHEINMVGRWNLGKWTVAATWIYATGAAYTAPESQYFIDLLNGESISYIHVSDKNANRLPDYQRLDLSVSYRLESESWRTELGLSIFNAYNHKNVWYREYNLDTVPVTITDALMLGFTPTLYIQINRK